MAKMISWLKPYRGKLYCLLLIATVSLLYRHAMGQAPNDYPSAIPENEVAVTNEESFVAACMSRIQENVTELRWVLGKSQVTRSENFGLVWRVDFEVPGQRPSAPLGPVNRIVCWRPTDSNDIRTAFLFGKHVPKLK